MGLRHRERPPPAGNHVGPGGVRRRPCQVGPLQRIRLELLAGRRLHDGSPIALRPVWFAGSLLMVARLTAKHGLLIWRTEREAVPLRRSGLAAEAVFGSN